MLVQVKDKRDNTIKYVTKQELELEFYEVQLDEKLKKEIDDVLEEVSKETPKEVEPKIEQEKPKKRTRRAKKELRADDNVLEETLKVEDE